jgi:hypothetical protein
MKGIYVWAYKRLGRIRQVEVACYTEKEALAQAPESLVISGKVFRRHGLQSFRAVQG